MITGKSRRKNRFTKKKQWEETTPRLCAGADLFRGLDEHIGIAVNSIAEALPFYEKVLGLKCYNIEEVADQKVKTAFFMIGQTKIELLESTDPEGPVGKFIEKRGEGIHHIAFAVDNIGERLREAEAAGVRLIDAAPRKGAEGLSIAFLHPKSTFGVLTELCEDKNSENNK